MGPTLLKEMFQNLAVHFEQHQSVYQEFDELAIQERSNIAKFLSKNSKDIAKDLIDQQQKKLDS